MVFLWYVHGIPVGFLVDLHKAFMGFLWDLDDIAGKKIATIRSQNTGGWNSWKTVETELLEKVEGVHDLFLVFTSRHGTTKIMNVNWLIIN